MSDWVHNLPIVWMALLVLGLTALVIATIYLVITVLSVGERARSFKAVSPGMLPPLGVLFALFVAFAASQVWSDNDKANSAVDHEASALRSVVILAAAFPGEPETRLRSLIRSYVGDAVAQEWPMMARGTATLRGAQSYPKLFPFSKSILINADRNSHQAHRITTRSPGHPLALGSRSFRLHEREVFGAQVHLLFGQLVG